MLKIQPCLIYLYCFVKKGRGNYIALPPSSGSYATVYGWFFSTGCDERSDSAPLYPSHQQSIDIKSISIKLSHILQYRSVNGSVIEPDTEMQRCRRRLESRISNVYYCTNFNLKK